MSQLERPTGVHGDCAIRHQRIADLAWSAGFIDGDGCISAVLQRHRDRKTCGLRIRLCVVQNDHHTLHHLQRVLGIPGHLHAVKRQPSQNRTVYQLQYDQKHAIAVLKQIRPYLIRKGPEADVCMQLFIDGWLDRLPGRDGFPLHVIEARTKGAARLRRMK